MKHDLSGYRENLRKIQEEYFAITGHNYTPSMEKEFGFDSSQEWEWNKPWCNPECTGDLLVAMGTMIKLLDLSRYSSILDLGCGGAWTSVMFARNGWDTTAVDLNSDLLNIGRENSKKMGLSLKFIEANMEQFHIDEKFDAIVSFDALHHVMDEREVLTNAFTMTKKKGKILVCEPDYHNWNSVGLQSGDKAIETMKKYRTLEKCYGTGYIVKLLMAVGYRNIRVVYGIGTYRRFIIGENNPSGKETISIEHLSSPNILNLEKLLRLFRKIFGNKLYKLLITLYKTIFAIG